MRKISMTRSTPTLELVDEPVATSVEVELWDPTTRIDAALAAFDRLVAEIDGATVFGQALVVDGRVLIDLSESDDDLLAA